MKYLKYPSFLFIFLIGFLSFLSAQDIFEEAVKGDSPGKIGFEFSGYIRSVLYAGESLETAAAEFKSTYGEVSLELKASHSKLGDAFAEIRYRRGKEFGENISQFDLREAYVNTYIGPVDIRVGHQVVAWGRADLLNPTDNITPKNLLVRSPEEDDRRQANFLLRTVFNFKPTRIEAIWIPIYRASVLPLELFPLPPGIELSSPHYPADHLENSAYAFKLNLELPSFDGSVSYFNGFHHFPGITSAVTLNAPPAVLLRAYRTHIFGLDFSTNIGSLLGLRGEIAYRTPHRDHEVNVYIPNPDLQYCIGIDRGFGNNLHIILQYIGRYVFEFTDLQLPVNPLLILEYELGRNNRMISFQQYRIAHALSWRWEWKLLHENLQVEFIGMVNFTSDEYLLRPRISYDIADALTASIGGEFYTGPEDTLFGAIDTHLNSIYLELKKSF